MSGLFNVAIEALGDGFHGQVLGAPQWSATGPTRDAVLVELQKLLVGKIASGALTILSVPAGLAHLAGKWRDDPSLPEMIADIYRARDEDRERICAELDRQETEAAARANG